ncbi:uncharacterized protein LOC110687012 [Chenopodium quinoa]|uniref:uncharacterized protein LOC110687012 n=1 Tax=Chenopodium quinoa TaxID=63459 RepID=UPI000B77ECB5|nr:uncharacterized protein LOC110687012 [Chenopodium quinoa]
MESLRLDQIVHHIDTPTSPSPEMFSFPGTPADDQSEFEFGSCVTPDSPTMSSSDVTKNNLVDDFSTTSPADQFFLNGRLLPHDFPVVHMTSSSTRASFSGRENMGPGATVTLSRGTSAGSNRSGSCGSSQYSSKDYSLVSSRSNSTNSSRGSTCSTCTSNARISSSEVTSDRKTFPNRMHSVKEKNVSNSPLGKYYKFGASGSSQRWQFITAVPVLGPSQSRRGRRENGGGTGTSPRMMRDVGSKEKRGGDNNNGSFLYKILRSVVATCKACHAMEGQENEFELDATNDVLGH